MIDWMLIGAALGLPFAIMGAIYAGKKVYEHILLRKGYIKAHFKKDNFQITNEFVKPVDRTFTLKLGDIERQFDFENTAGKCLYDGNQPFVIYDERTGKQMSFVEELFQKEELTSNDKSILLKRFFNYGYFLGKLQLQKESGNKDILLYIGAIGAALACIGIFVMYQNIDPILKEIAAKVATLNMPVIR